MQTSARVVIIGGGIMGASLLYHLAELGWTDCLLIEKDELTSGSTWHAAGQCPNITGSYNLAKMHAYSNQLYPQLEGLTGQYVSWHKSGGIRLATNERELAWMRYIQGFSKIIGFEMEIIPPEEILRSSSGFSIKTMVRVSAFAALATTSIVAFLALFTWVLTT